MYLDFPLDKTESYFCDDGGGKEVESSGIARDLGH